ncbi:MAG: hypothetical protein HDS35_07980 [Bacteroides sp.]|nr:hypothetical protein [Bacteroides sp.]
MLHKLRISLVIIISFLLASCGKKEVALQFSLPKDLSANIRVVHYASDKKGGMMIESVATIMGGKGELRLPNVNPTLIYLYAGGNLPLAVYAEKGDKITISGSDKNPDHWSIGGNGINEDLTLWRNAHATTLYSGTPEEVNEAVADYVERNTDNPASAILLLTSYYRQENERQFLDLWYSLGEKADRNRWMKMVGRADLTESSLRHPGQLKSMALRSLANGVDTIRPSAGGATILFFWSNGMESRKEMIDSLKVLAKEYPDSAKRIIADICVDPDSISWRSPLRRDSVKNIARFWVPAGLADRRLMNLQVSRLPFFMVVAPNGIQTYRGSDTGKAMEAFRRLAASDSTLTKKK